MVNITLIIPNFRKEIVMATNEEAIFFHELAHAAHYRIDPKAINADKSEKELIAELSAAALCQLTGKKLNIGNHFRYIKKLCLRNEAFST